MSGFNLVSLALATSKAATIAAENAQIDKQMECAGKKADVQMSTAWTGMALGIAQAVEAPHAIGSPSSTAHVSTPPKASDNEEIDKGLKCSGEKADSELHRAWAEMAVGVAFAPGYEAMCDRLELPLVAHHLAHSAYKNDD